MSQPLRVLIVEDSEDDALLLVRALRKGGFDPVWQRVYTAADVQTALQQSSWDIVICDYSMPKFDARDALHLVKAKDLDLPFIVVSGAIGEDVAVETMKAGAHDYLMKGNLARLVPAVTRELQEAEERRKRKKAEEALQIAQKTESLGLMAGGVAHDFNNLLTAVLTQTSIALKKIPEDNEAVEHINKAIIAAKRAAELTNQMLNYAGSGASSVGPLDLNKLIQENMDLLQTAIPKEVEVRYLLGDRLPIMRGDASQIQQVIMNLVLNAAEAMNGKPGTITVETGPCIIDTAESDAGSFGYKEPANGTYVVLTVQDDGEGMDEPTLARIFDPFFTTKKFGRGLGLAALLGIVRSHKGWIKVGSELGRGTTFKIFFPSDNMSPLVGPQTFAESEDIAVLPEGTVLVIDDEEPLREAVSAILSLSGFEVLLAESGSAGIDLYRTYMKDIEHVLLDIAMPGMSGEETLDELLKLDPDLHVILSSGHVGSEVLHRLDAGCNVDFIQKPYNAADLLKRICVNRRPQDRTAEKGQKLRSSLSSHTL